MQNGATLSQFHKQILIKDQVELEEQVQEYVTGYTQIQYTDLSY